MALVLEHAGRRPRVDPSAYVAPNAVLCGDVRVGPDCRILFGAVLTAEGGHVALGRSCIVMENAVLRGREQHPLVLGDHVLVGPHAHLNGATIADEAFLATGVCAFPGARIGERAELRIGAIVHVNSAVAAETIVPIGWLALGDPARLLPPERDEEIRPLQRSLDFPGTVFGLPRGEARMAAVTARYAELFGRHRGDRAVEG